MNPLNDCILQAYRGKVYTSYFQGIMQNMYYAKYKKSTCSNITDIFPSKSKNTQKGYLDTQRALKWDSKVTWVLEGHSKGTWENSEHLGTLALGHSKHLGIWTLRHYGAWRALGHSRYSRYFILQTPEKGYHISLLCVEFDFPETKKFLACLGKVHIKPPLSVNTFWHFQYFQIFSHFLTSLQSYEFQMTSFPW